MRSLPQKGRMTDGTAVMVIDMGFRMKAYNALVNRVPEIRKRYHTIRDGQTTTPQRLCAWLFLIGLNSAWLFGWRGRSDTQDQDIRRARQLPKESESSMSVREAPGRLAEKLLDYDLISFDVFDTLLFRPFSSPEDLFYLVGQKLDYLDFRRIRMEAETAAREIHRKKTGNSEVTLREIYEYLEQEAGIPCEEGMYAELETEEALCFANPYFLKVFQHLKRSGKRVIAVSDMYLPEQAVRMMLEKSGFHGLDACMVSCEYGLSKSEGDLFGKAAELFGPESSRIHIGDNRIADVENAQRAGWKALYYTNVNQAGMRFRPLEISAVTGSIYRGLVNAHIHCGLEAYSKDYEYGFIYGGLFVLGYCQFIHEYADRNRIDRILFLARDGDILKQVYDRLYPREAEEGRTCYVLWSRLAAAKMTARYYKHDYFRRFLFHKVNQGFTIGQVFETMDLSDMLEDMEKRTEGQLTADTRLTDGNVGQVKSYLNERWIRVLSHYDGQLENGREYMEKILEGCSSAAAVDIGWAGSGALALRMLADRVWKLNCSITGLVAGTNCANSAEPDMSEAQLADHTLVSYLFSQSHNRDLWKRHNPAKGDNVALERLLSSPYRSFRGFRGNGCMEALTEGKDAEQAGEIQRGILDYCMLYQKNPVSSMTGNISGRDAAAPILMWIQANRRQMEKEDCQCVLA